MKMLFTVAVLSALVMSVPAVAAESPPAPVDQVQVQSAAPAAVTLTAEQLAELVAKVQAPAAAPAKSAAVTPDGILGLSWATLAGWLGALGAFLFGLWKTTTGAKVRKLVEDAIAAAWWVAERNGQDYPGVVKASLAMRALYEALAQQGIPLDPKVGALAMAKWGAMAAQDGIQRPRFDAPAPEQLAKAQAAASAATAPGSAADLANQAAR